MRKPFIAVLFFAAGFGLINYACKPKKIRYTCAAHQSYFNLGSETPTEFDMFKAGDSGTLEPNNEMNVYIPRFDAKLMVVRYDPVTKMKMLRSTPMVIAIPEETETDDDPNAGFLVPDSTGGVDTLNTAPDTSGTNPMPGNVSIDVDSSNLKKTAKKEVKEKKAPTDAYLYRIDLRRIMPPDPKYRKKAPGPVFTPAPGGGTGGP